MLKGMNEIRFNEATMIEIVQFYLNNKMLNKDEPGPTVTGVKLDNSGHNNMFSINLAEKAQVV